MTNQFIPDFWVDPCVLEENGNYYLYAVKDGGGWGYEEISVRHSLNMKDWSLPKEALHLKDVTWARWRASSPSVIKRNGKYYLFFSVEEQVGLAVSDSPMGPYRDMLGQPLIVNNQFGTPSVDPDLFIDEDGTPYLLWGRGACRIVQLEDDLYTFAGEPTWILNTPAEGGEGPHLYKFEGRYWLLWSVGKTIDPNYHIRYASSVHPLGPYECPEDNRFIRAVDGIYGTGNGSTVCLEGQWYLCYQRLVDPEKHPLRELCCSPIRSNFAKPYVDPKEGLPK